MRMDGLPNKTFFLLNESRKKKQYFLKTPHILDVYV